MKTYNNKNKYVYLYINNNPCNVLNKQTLYDKMV